MLIPLFLFQKRALASPMFYLSEYLESHHETYYARLRGISRENDWTGWVEFFLTAITAQARTNTARVRGILDLYAEMKLRISDLIRSQHSLKVLDALFDRPVFQAGEFMRAGVPKPTASRFLTALRNAGILQVLRPARGSQSAVMAFRELLNRAEGREVL